MQNKQPMNIGLLKEKCFVWELFITHCKRAVFSQLKLKEGNKNYS